MTLDALSYFYNAFTGLAVIAAVSSVAVALLSAIRSGVIKQITLGKLLTIEGGISPAEVAAERKPIEVDKPFEATALANYYNQVLARSNISFWFSLVFASIGFGVIIFAFLTHNSADVTGSIVKVTSGVVIDSVASLFFVQSVRAQKSMSEFFEKLRLDRGSSVAREMIAEIEDPERRDQLRAQLIIKYAAIEKFVTGGAPAAGAS